ncbi:reverse transcriptase domain-containing protein, partial [Acidithiobacillus sp.]|uniref:reverse transcriptase domain-containing protein n=1 Tax=Acidithiobacillus sp. TaxID=1872118 RepID=UPI003D0804A6
SFVTHEGHKKVVYVQVLRALYGMLVAALLWYKKFRSDLEQQGFVFNPYDPCVANKVVNNKQHTVRFHVDVLMSSHVDTKVNDNFEKWLNKMYGAHGEVKTTRGKDYDYLGMVFDFSQEGQVKVDMVDYISNMVEEFAMNLKPTDTVPTPASDNIC